MSKKVIWHIFRVIITIMAFIIGGYVLYKFEYFNSFNDIDNVVGIIPVILVITGVGGITAVLWIKHTKQFFPCFVSFVIDCRFVCHIVSCSVTGKLVDKYYCIERNGSKTGFDSIHSVFRKLKNR